MGYFSKGHTLFDKRIRDLLPLHMVVLENSIRFFVTIRKGNVTPWDQCEEITQLILVDLSPILETKQKQKCFSKNKSRDDTRVESEPEIPG